MGGRDLDLRVMDVLGREFKKNHGVDPRKIAKCRLRLLENIEKAR